MPRRTREELEKAEKRRLAKLKKQLKKTNSASNSKSTTKTQAALTAQQKKSNEAIDVPDLFQTTFGYDFSLIKTDLIRTFVVTAIVSLMLVGIVFYF